MTAQYLDKEKVLKAMSECDGNRVDKMEMDAEIRSLLLLLLKMQDQIRDWNTGQAGTGSHC